MPRTVSLSVTRVDVPDELASREMAALARGLRESPVERLSPLVGESTSDGKGIGEALGLVLTVAEGLPALRAAVDVVVGWLSTSRSARSVTIELEGRRLVLSNATAAQQCALVEGFLDSLSAE